MRRLLTSVLNTLPNGAKAVQGGRRTKTKLKSFDFLLLSRSLLNEKAVQGVYLWFCGENPGICNFT